MTLPGSQMGHHPNQNRLLSFTSSHFVGSQGILDNVHKGCAKKKRPVMSFLQHFSIPCTFLIFQPFWVEKELQLSESKEVCSPNGTLDPLYFQNTQLHSPFINSS